MFYMPRLLIYMTEALSKNEPERSILVRQLTIMASRLWYGITWPSAVITFVLGASLIINNPGWLRHGYMHLKLLLVVLLYGYHFSLHYIFRRLKHGTAKYSSQQLRIWNEVATLFLVSIVFVIVLKDALGLVWGLLGLTGLILLIAAGIVIYRRIRNNK